MKQRPDLESLFAAGGLGGRDRLRRTHDLLLRAGPLPELPPSLSEPPKVAIRVLRPNPARAHRRIRALLLPAGAALALAAGTAVYLSNRQDDSVHTSVAMHATAAAPRASAVLTVGGRDRSGNWSITLHVRGLPALPRGSVYEMYVTDEDRLVGSCGVFRTDGKPTVVEFNVPYTLADDSGWLIRREQPHRPPSAPLLTTQT